MMLIVLTVMLVIILMMMTIVMGHGGGKDTKGDANIGFRICSLLGNITMSNMVRHHTMYIASQIHCPMDTIFMSNLSLIKPILVSETLQY